MRKLIGRESAALLLTLVLAGCRCETDVKQELSSSDGVHRAVLFERNCGALSNNNLQVAIVSGRDHPDERSTVLIVTDTTSRGSLIKDVVQITWEKPTTLRIGYDPMLKVIYRESKADGVAIHFTAVAGVDSVPATRTTK